MAKLTEPDSGKNVRKILFLNFSLKDEETAASLKKRNTHLKGKTLYLKIYFVLPTKYSAKGAQGPVTRIREVFTVFPKKCQLDFYKASEHF